MRSSSVLVLSLILGTTPLLAALQDGSQASIAPAPSCSAPAHGQFDFWVGDWVVTDRETGKPAGVNRIEKILGGCALLESWTGAMGLKGNSLTFYDASRDRWHQTWIDSSGTPLYLEGGQIDGAIRLEGESPGGKDEAPVRHRISWSLTAERHVRQYWQSSEDGGASWSDVFDGLYKRATGSLP